MRWGRKPQPAIHMPPAAWYPDPHNASQIRYWDGTAWTEHFAPAGPPTTGSDVQVHDPGAADEVVRSSPKAARSHAGRHQRGHGVQPTLEQLVATARLEPPRHPLDEQVEVAGETYHVKSIKRVFRQFGMPISDGGCTLDEIECILAPEPWNPHDVNAVAVVIGSHHVGYLPAELAADYAHRLARLAANGVLTTGVARLWAKSEAGMVRARVTILIPESHQF
jgi:Protein of unknown function (DUF2510)